MRVLELFCGSRSISNVAEEMGHEVITSDIHPFDRVDIVCDIMDFAMKDVPFIPDMIWASPPCTFFSVASIGHHWNKDHTPKTANARIGVDIVRRTLQIIDYYLAFNPDLKWFMENPRGKLRKLDVVSGRDKATVTYCQYGDTRMKPTDIWTNALDLWKPRKMCHNGNKDCHHEAAPRGTKTGGTQGIKGAYNRSKIPRQLCIEILDSVLTPRLEAIYPNSISLSEPHPYKTDS